MTFSGLALASLVLSGVQLQWFGASGQHTAGLLILATAVPLQFLAAAWAFSTGTTAETSGAGVLGATWLAIALTPGTPKPLGVLVLVSAALMLSSAVNTGAVIPTVIMGLAGVRFALTGIATLAASPTWRDISGVVGVVLCGLAIGAVAWLDRADG